MRKVFLDANVYFSGILNPDGGSGFILQLAEKKKFFHLVASPYVIGETMRNLESKSSPTQANVLKQYLDRVSPELVSPQVSPETAAIINDKDAPVLQAVLDAKCDILVTLDRRHFLQPAVLNFGQQHNLVIQTPKEFLEGLIALGGV